MMKHARAIASFTAIFLAALIAACVIHEFGHAVAAWVQGIASIPTPLKAYVISHGIRWEQEAWILFGGVAGSILCSGCALVWYGIRTRKQGEAILAGILAVPVVYSIRFLLVGRGHDGVEWQGAQTVIGVSPTGHLVDYVFLFVVFAGIVAWVVRRRSDLHLLSFAKLAVLIVFAFVALALLQNLNNHLFDRYLEDPQSDAVDRPGGLDPR